MSHNVLVVDDEPKLCDLLSSALSQNDVHVFTASNGVQALAFWSKKTSTWSSAIGACRAWTGRNCWPKSNNVIRTCR